MQEIINKISAELDIHPDIVEKAVRAQFEYVKNTMESGEMRSVQLQYLGKFAVKPMRLKILQERKLKHLEDQNPVE